MKKKTIEVHSGLPLGAVLRELAEKLIADDWVRYATSDGGSVFYIVGVNAHAADQEGTLEHLSLSVPPGSKVTAIGEHQVHAQVASRKPAEYYLRRARAQLEDTGIAPAEIDRFIDLFRRGEDFIPVVAPWQISQTSRFDAFIDLLRVLALHGGANVDDLATESERRGAVDAALPKVYLDELARLFDGVVRRAGPLEKLAFNDEQLNEASRCFLYGFFRGAVVLSASALETQLRKAIGPRGVERVDQRSSSGRNRGYFNVLVDEADEQGVLGARTRPGEEPALVVGSRKVFAERTKVVHKGFEPAKELAEDLLDRARQVIDYIQGQPTRSRGHEA